MSIHTQTYDKQTTQLAFEYTMLDLKRSLVTASVLANLGLFVSWLAIALS